MLCRHGRQLSEKLGLNARPSAYLYSIAFILSLQLRTDPQIAFISPYCSPDGYLRSLPLPGQRLATGPWSLQEVATFEQRLREFRQNKWSISYWVRNKKNSIFWLVCNLKTKIEITDSPPCFSNYRVYLV